MGATFNCRVCETPLKEIPRLLFPPNSFPGKKSVCMECFVMGLPNNTANAVIEHLVHFRNNQRDSLAVARERIRELEDRLAMANKTIANLQPSRRD